MMRPVRFVGGLILALSLLPRLAHAQTETVEYYGTDVIGSIRIVWDATGNVVGRQDYAPFGRPLLPAAGLSKQGFGAQETDAETDQGYFHARMFQGRTGRFTRPDPIQAGFGSPQRWNRYAYASNSPLSRQDFGGLSDCPAGHYCEDVTVVGQVPAGGNRDSAGGVGGFGLDDSTFEIDRIDYGGGVGGGTTATQTGTSTTTATTTTTTKPPTVPPLPPHTPKPEREAFERGFNEMMRRLGQAACGDLFGGTASAQRAATEANYRFLPLGGPSRGPDGNYSVIGAATISTTTPQHVLINSEGPFKNPNMMTLDGPKNLSAFNLNATSNAAFILLHETGHLTTKFGPDAGNTPLVTQYNERVFKVCF